MDETTPPVQRAKKLPFESVLKGLMKEHGLTLSDIARMSNVSKGVVYNWLHGASPQNLWALSKLAESLDVSLHFLLFGENEKSMMEKAMSGTKEVVVLDGICRVLITRLDD